MSEQMRILKKTEPGVCGGTDAWVDESAPREIGAEEMTLFRVTSVLPPVRDGEENDQPIDFVSAFAAPDGEGTFLFLETGTGPGRRAKSGWAWAWVQEDVLPVLAKLVREHDVAADNGRHAETHGLPENFGGSVDIRYAGGETIRFSNNRAPVLSRAFGEAVAAKLGEAMAGDGVALPPLSALREIRFLKEREDGGFTRATLTLQGDGTAINAREQRFADPTVYRSEKTVEVPAVAELVRGIGSTGLLAWAGLPGDGIVRREEKRLVFRFDGGREITVPQGRLTPERLCRGFFAVELALVTKF